MIVELEQPKYDLAKLGEGIAEVREAMNVAGIEADIARLKEEQNAEDFWTDIERAQKVSKELKALENKLSRFNALVTLCEDTDMLIDLSNEEDDRSSLEEIVASVELLGKRLEELKLETLLRGKYDRNSAILMIHSGAGGTEAQDWTDMLYRMYTRFAERRGYAVKLIDLLPGDEAGIKSVTFSVSGENAYGFLKAEKGVHRLVRISPFDSNARRHTSFASLEVTPEIEDEIEINIAPDEIKVDTYRSGGAGGQHVNKTESAVRITHIPTGIIVQCQNERSQVQNREVAMKMLYGKLVERAEREQMEKAQEIKGELKKIEWGSQIRSYVFQPYTMVKDHRTGCETGNITAVMDGEIDEFINEYLKKA